MGSVHVIRYTRQSLPGIGVKCTVFGRIKAAKVRFVSDVEAGDDF